ncbi:cation transporter [Ornithinibacillus scapharcae]|uniref:cation transporter n=1 Tax=Ornithinibacillus scapharcae TaxID=1147159 RepID=UPI001ED9750E|nr:cation transporter [Ornithinibacillus scapharcae]
MKRYVEENLNMKSALLHVLGDLLGSVGAIISRLLGSAFNWYWADPIASIYSSNFNNHFWVSCNKRFASCINGRKTKSH